MVKEFTNKYLPIPYVEGTHFQTSFGHLDGYSAVYYTYMWSLVIAKDMFSQFDPESTARAGDRREYRESPRARRLEARRRARRAISSAGRSTSRRGKVAESDYRQVGQVGQVGLERLRTAQGRGRARRHCADRLVEDAFEEES